ncbi:MAG: Ig-like domain-containing protein [Candidatus Eremiobacteraeota bacterium]|nr:Ig-like domain-containing protein [Candidatus Eremiobacteraeota bacterium]
MNRPRRLAVLCCGLVALGITGCTRSGPGSLEQELPKELLDVLPLGEKRPVEVVLASPQGDMADLDQGQSIVMAFNQPMVPLRPVSTDVNVDFVEITPKIDGRFRWKGTATLVFEPKVKLPYGTRFKVTVKKGLKSWAEQQLAQDYTFHFVTPTVALAHTLPMENSEMQGVDEPIYLHFNQPVKPEDIRSSIKLRQGSETMGVQVRAYTEDDRKAESKAADVQDAYELPRPNGLVEGPVENAVVVTPEKPLQPGELTSVLLLSGMKGMGGPEGTPSERSYDFTTRKPFALTANNSTVDPEGGVSVQFTTPVSPALLRKNLTIEPPVELPEFETGDDYASSECYLGGTLKPNSTYTLRFGEGLVDRYGAKLNGAREFKITTSDYREMLQGPEGSGVLELNGPRKLPYGVRNMEKVTAKVRKLSPAEVISVTNSGKALYSSEAYTPPGGFSQTLNLGGVTRRNEEQQRNVSLPGGGFYYVQATADSQSMRSLVAVTDVGVTAKFSAENCLIYTTSLKDVKPVGGAQVELYSAEGTKLWSGKTDGEGFCQAPGWAKLGLTKSEEWSPPDLWIFVKSGDSQSYVHSAGYNSVGPWAFNIDYTTNQSARTFQAFAFAERGVYKPGEVVELKGSLREMAEGSWKLPAGVDKVLYKVFDSRDRELTKGQLPINRFGGFDQSLSLKSDSLTGLYRVEYRLPENLEKSLKWSEPVATVGFQVEAFKPAQFEVTVNSAKSYYVMGDKAQVDIKGWYLFGAPMNERPATWTARLEPSELRPDGYEGFDFGLSWDEEHQDESKELASGKGDLDGKGLLHQEIALEKIPFRGSANLVVEGGATAPNRQTLSGRKVIPLYRGEFQLGLRNESTFGPAGQAHKVEVVAVRPEGDRQQGVNLKVELLRRQWNSVQKGDESGGYRWVSEVKDEKIEEKSVRSSTEPLAVEFTPPKAGYYLVRASAQDSRGNAVVSESGFYAEGSDYVAWERSEDDIIKLVSDKKSYKPGDTATILVKSPYEKTRALVTLERDHILERQVVELTGTAPTIKVPLTPRHLPNVYVSVILLQGRNPKQEFSPGGKDLSKPTFKLGYINLPVAPEEKRLTVQIKTDKEKYQPGEEVVADFQVTDSTGAPVESELTVAVPDQGVLALTGYTLPDWFSSFYGARALGVTTCETRMDVIGLRSYGAKGKNAGGGGGFDAAEGRDDFRYTAYWNPSLTSNAQGKAQIHFNLPDNLTTFKVMALAQTINSHFGSAEAKFEVAKPLLLQPSVPDFARLNDDFQAGVVVRNNTSNKLSVKVSAHPEGVKLEGEGSKTLELAAGKEQEVLFHFQADKLGDAKFNFQAQSGEYNDGLTLPLKLQQSVILEHVSTSGSTAESAAVEMVVPSPMSPGTGMLRLLLSSSALVGLEGPLKELENTTLYGLEPRLSQIRAGLSARDLARALDQDRKEDPLQKWLQDTSTFAVGEKGYTAYDSQWGRPDPYLTSYALETFYLARKAGLSVENRQIDIARAFLKDYLNNPQDYSKWTRPAEGRTLRCFALYALSLGEFDGLSYFNNLLRSRADVPLEGRVYLLLAGRKLGASQTDLDLLQQDLINAAKVEANTVYFEDGNEKQSYWTFSSNNKLTALALKALMDSPKGYPQASKVVSWLMEARTKNGDWGDPHDDARVMETLYQYFSSQEKDRPNFEATAFVGKEQVQKVSFLGRDLKVEQTTRPIATAVERLAVGLKKVGSGRLYYEMRLSYVAAKEPPARDEGLAVLKKISTVKGDAFPAALKAGETYMVTLTVVSPRDRRFVMVNDPLPAGCEVVQTQFETESAEMKRILAASQSKSGNSTFVHFEKYADRVALFADGLQAGEHTFQYLVRANQPGKFAMPATKAEEIYHPEIFGTTTGRVVEIQ